MKKFSFAACLSLILMLFLALGTVAANGQSVTGRIKGTVTDPTGAVVPSAAITATNSATGVKYTSKTGANGDYLFPQLPTGTYSVSATAPGFKTFTATGIVINIDEEYVESIKLPVGGSNETLEVAADAVQVNTTDMQLNNIVSSEQMVELPLIGRAFTGLELTLPGVQASSDRFGTYSVSGAQTQQSEYLINGADTNDIALNTIAFSPNLDAIDQFNLIDGPLNAEYDRNSGGIVSATIKQGTNHFHGDIFEFYRDTFLNTNNFFQKTYTTAGVLSSKVTPYHQNIFGGTVGGPIIKDKLFFFGAYQGTHQRVPESGGSASVYTASELTGNWSADNGPAGTPPAAGAAWGNFTGTTIPGTITIAGCTAGQSWAQCAYALGGMFPVGSMSSIAKSLVTSYVPTPNSGTNGYSFNPVVGTTINQYIGRGDYAINPKNQLTFLYIYHKSSATETLPFTGASLPGFGDEDVLTVNQYTFDYVHQFNSTLVNDLAAHYTRFNYQAVIPQKVVTPASLGFSISPQDAAAASVPTISVSGPAATGSIGFTLGFSTNGPQPRIDQAYQLDDSVSKVFGHHTFKFGYDGRRFNVTNPFYAVNSGSYSFSYTNGGYTTGDGALDFLLGVPNTYAQGTGATIEADAFLNYMYAQDTWKATSNFTVDYGLGYSIDTPLRNHQYGGEGIGCMIPGEQSTVFPNAPKGFVYPGDPGCFNTGQAYTRYSEFGPRIGFAWSPDLGKISGGPGKFSIRGGFGIYYDRSEEESSLQTLETPPFGLSSNGATDYTGGAASFANPYRDLNTGVSYTNKFPYTFPAKGAVINYGGLEPIDASTYGPSFRAPYAENFQLSVEREFASRVVARVSYVGSLARHNQTTPEANYETAAGHAACLAGIETSPVLGPGYSCSTNRNNQSYFWPNNTVGGSVDPASGGPGFTSVGQVSSTATSSYHGLQASVEKGLTHGFTFQLSYTYSHAMDSGSSFENSGFGGSRGYNQFQQSLNYGDSQYDARQRLVFSPIYISPILHGSSWYSAKNLAISGWEVSAIATVATGFPYDVAYDGASSLSLWCSDNWNFYACPDVPNQIGPLQRANPRANRYGTINGVANGTGRTAWFQNPTQTFSAEVLGTFGNEHRDAYHGPGTNNTNMIIAKNFNLSADGVRKLQLRMESDNVFNHTQFSNPTASYTSSALGQVSGAASARQTQLAAKIYF